LVAIRGFGRPSQAGEYPRKFMPTWHFGHHIKLKSVVFVNGPRRGDPPALAVERSVAKKAKPSITTKPPFVLGMPALGVPAAIGLGFAQPTMLEPRKIVRADQKSSTFELDDKTTLTIRPVLIDVKRAKDQWDASGKPVYIMTLANVTETDSPSKLMDPRFVSVTAKNKKRKRRARR
jgi:hypothetical protein